MSEIDDIINMLDGKCEKGVSRIKVNVPDVDSQGNVSFPADNPVFSEKYHHGRCDVGSPWAKGTVSNFDSIDGCE